MIMASAQRRKTYHRDVYTFYSPRSLTQKQKQRRARAWKKRSDVVILKLSSGKYACKVIKIDLL